MIGLQSITVVVAAVALILSLTGLSNRVTQTETAIQSSAYNSCQLLRELIHATAVSSAQPQKQSAALRAYIQRTPLRNCHRYSITISNK